MDADPGGSGRGLLVVVAIVEADAVDAVAMLLSALVGLPAAAAEGADKNEALLPPPGGEKDTADVPGRSDEPFGALPPPPIAEPPLKLPVVRRKGRGSRLLMVGGFVSFE